ncbi:MAG TPA: hypothetical protein V6D33_17025 [Cyanophyceae cyanobacterium]
MNSSNDEIFIRGSAEPNDSAMGSLCKLWAKKYVQSLVELDLSQSRRAERASQLLTSLRNAGIQAWLKTENLLTGQVERHKIDPRLIDPWEISKDVHYIYQKALSAYTENVIPRRLSVLISADLGRIRQKWTKVDPRVIAFVSMQFHHTGQQLLYPLSTPEQLVISEYFKVIDDYLYMPLQRAYHAAAKYKFDAPQLTLVQQLLPISNQVAHKICDRVLQLYPHYRCASGLLSNPMIQISSIRDVEMFQVYLWVCILEESLAVIQQELFPLCVMLYPTLNVSWELVRQMLFLLGKEIQNHLGSEQLAMFQPYFQSLWEMFSPEVLSTAKS